MITKKINIVNWNRILNKFNEDYKKFSDNELVIEDFTTTSYRYHEQCLEFDLYKNIIFKIAIPYACKITFL